MKKIIFVDKFYFPALGGMETITREMAEGLLAHGYSVEVLACVPKGKAEELTVNGVKVHKAASFGIMQSTPISFDFFWKFKRLAREADIIFLQHPFPLATLAHLLFAPRKKIVLWYHSDIERQKTANFFFAPLLAASLRRARTIFVSGKNIIMHSPYLTRFREKCRVIPFGIDVKEFEPIPAILEEAQAIRKKFGDPLLLFVGRLVAYKGLEYLIRAMGNVKARLIVVGTGPLKENLERIAHESGVENKILFTGRVEKTMPYYYACDIFVLPSIYKTEAFGVVQLEAMACGKPVINTALPTAVPEVGVSGETGYTVPPRDQNALADAINTILSDPALREKMGNAARERVRQLFSRERFIEDVAREIEAQ